MPTASPIHRPRTLYRSVLHFSRTLHTYFSMLATVLFVFFGTTGFMLNHPVWFKLDKTRTTELNVSIPPAIIASKDKLALVEFLRASGATGAVEKFDWPDEGEAFHIAFKSPKSQCDADIAMPDGQTRLTIETHGLLGLITRLHTAKDAGPVWRLFLDCTAVLLVLVCITGLILWQSLPKRRLIGSIAMALSIVAIAAAYWLCVPWR